MDMKNTRFYRTALQVLMLLSFWSTMIVSQFNSANATNTVLKAICPIYKTATTVIFILGLTLMIIGAVLYAGSNIAPGQAKGSLQGYGMGMIIGGVVGVVISLLAPFILQLITSNSQIAAICASF